MTELIRKQDVISGAVRKMYPTLDEESLLEWVQGRCMHWVNQVLVFEFNSGKYGLHVKTLSHLNDVNMEKKDNSYMFLITPKFKFLDVRNYLAPSLCYDGWCKANRCEISELVFPYEWLDDYNNLSHMGPVAYKNFYS